MAIAVISDEFLMVLISMGKISEDDRALIKVLANIVNTFF